MHKELIGKVQTISVHASVGNAMYTVVQSQDGKIIGGIRKLVLTLDYDKSYQWQAEIDSVVLQVGEIEINGANVVTTLHRALCTECKQIKQMAEGG